MRLGAYEIGHELNALGIIHTDEFHPVLLKKNFRSQKVLVFSDNHAGDSVQQRRSRTHNARTESADKRQFWPVTTSSGVAKANRFRMSRRVAGLNPQIMSTRKNGALRIGQHRPDGQSAFRKPLAGFGQSFEK